MLLLKCKKGLSKSIVAAFVVLIALVVLSFIGGIFVFTFVDQFLNTQYAQVAIDHGDAIKKPFLIMDKIIIF